MLQIRFCFYFVEAQGSLSSSWFVVVVVCAAETVSVSAQNRDNSEGSDGERGEKVPNNSGISSSSSRRNYNINKIIKPMVKFTRRTAWLVRSSSLLFAACSDAFCFSACRCSCLSLSSSFKRPSKACQGMGEGTSQYFYFLTPTMIAPTKCFHVSPRCILFFNQSILGTGTFFFFLHGGRPHVGACIHP